MPAVSVVIPAYNHEKYIGECIQSVLNQTYQDFEIVITDDGSSDKTVDIVKSFDDPRIKLFKHSKNLGACVAANNCILYSSGKYIAVLSSDDVWYPHKLEEQVKYLETHPNKAAVFGKVDWIDEASEIIKNPTFHYTSVFDVENRTRFQWLRHFFLSGNCLCHPCSLVRRECYSIIGMLNPAFASIPDLDLWIRICLRYDIWILDQRLIKFRRFRDESNASGNNNWTFTRGQFEHRQTLNNYLKLSSPEELLLIFPEAIKYGNVTSETIPFILGRVAIDTGVPYKVLWGLDTIYTQLQDEEISQQIEDNCNFVYRDFIDYSANLDPFRIFCDSWIDPSRTGFYPNLKRRIAKLVLAILIEMKRKCPAWLKIYLKKVIFRIQSSPRMLRIIQRITPEFISRMYNRIRAS